MKSLVKNIKRIAVLMAAVFLISGCGTSSGSDSGTDTVSVSVTEESIGESINSEPGESEQTLNNEEAKDPEEVTETPESSGHEYIYLGKYEQNGSESDGAESIKWIILKKEAGRALILSNNVLDAYPFNEDFGSVSWKDSSIRKVLNNDFYNAAFSDADKEKILETVTEYKKETVIDENGEEKVVTTDEAETSDRIFLLSKEEALEAISLEKELFADECEKTGFMVAGATAYAVSHEVYAVSDEYFDSLTDEEKEKTRLGAAWWWLRDRGGKDTKAMDVAADGSIREHGHYLGEVHDGIRPAMWISYDEP